MGQGAEAVLQKRYGDEIAGLAFDNSTGTWSVAATSAASAAGIEEVFAADGLSGNVAINRVPYTRSDLVSTTEELSIRIRGLVGSGTATVGYGGGAITVDVSSDADQADVQSIDSAKNEAAAAANSPAIHVVSVPESTLVSQPASLSCTFPYCNSLVAGAKYYAPAPGKPGTINFCTEGWYGWSRASSGTTFEKLLTAGHCVNNMGGSYANNHTEVPGHGEVTIGYGVLHALGTGGDWGTVVFSPPLSSPLESSAFPGYYNWAGGYGTDLQAWYNSGWPAEGTIVCHQGIGSGLYSTGATQCGVVGQSTTNEEEDEGHTYTLNPVLQINETVVCGGDSGGPWFLESEKPTAVGITDTRSSGLNEHCGGAGWITTTSQINKMYANEGVSFGLYG
jgi:hypothetical protein